MSNRRRRQHVNARKRRNAAVVVASRLAGCTCNPDVRHITTGHHEVLHDAWCPMVNHASQVLVVMPNFRAPHREDPTR